MSMIGRDVAATVKKWRLRDDISNHGHLVSCFISQHTQCISLCPSFFGFADDCIFVYEGLSIPVLFSYA
ncbi:hypothetical protein ZEAMMB73_Zm00001d035581, partial [Zea mays]